MDKLIIGRYIVGDSFIHRLDPRSKLLAMLIYIVIIFWANNPLTYAVITLFTLFLVFLSKIKLGFFLGGIKPMIWIILFSTLFQVFFNTKGSVLWSIGFLKITEVGLNQGWMIFLRFILIISFSTLLTLTTTPLSLRFVPTLMDDTTRIMNAQKARGVDFGEGNIIQKVRSIIPILIPLFASSFKRADALAIAMEARGYQGGEGRTKYRRLSWNSRDTLSIIAILALGLMLFYLKS